MTHFARRLARPIAVALFGATASATLLHAQGGAGAPPDAAAQRAVASVVTNAVTRARGLVETGEGRAARALLDSLVGAQAPESDALAEALYWRAVLQESAAEAGRDWKQLVVEIPFSPRAPDALLRLAELEFMRGHPDVARAHLERLLRDHGTSAQQPRAVVGIARSYFEQRDAASACRTMASLTGALPDGEVQLQADELRGRCAAVAAAAATASSSASAATSESGPAVERPTAAATRGRYSVQLGAFPTRAEAERTVRRLSARGVSARVDGTRKPFRVRSGRYETRAQATAALRALAKKGQRGFVTELQ